MLKQGDQVIKAIRIRGKTTYHITKIGAVGKAMAFCEDSGIPYNVETGEELYPLFKPGSNIYSKLIVCEK